MSKIYNWNELTDIVKNVEEFIAANNYVPRTLKEHSDSDEYHIRINYNNRVTRKSTLEAMQTERPDLYARVQLIEAAKPKLRYTDVERIMQFEAFFHVHKRKPVATVPGSPEYGIARAYDADYAKDGKRRKNLSPELEARLCNLENQPEWKTRSTPEKTFQKGMDFCLKHKWYPIRNSPDPNERSLAASLAQTSRFTKEQNDALARMRHLYGRNKHVSFPEKVYYRIMSTIFGDEVSANRKICNHEADISFPYKGSFYIIQYDGKKYHSSREAITKDKETTTTHLNSLAKVIRLREIGLPTLNDDGAFPSESYLEIQVDPQAFTQEDIQQVVSEILMYIEYAGKVEFSNHWKEIIEAARYDASARKTAISAICDTLEYILRTGETPSRSSVKRGFSEGANLDKRVKSLLSRDQFEDIDLEVLALLEAFYEPNHCRRNQDAFVQRGFTLNIEKGSHFVNQD